MQPVRRFLVPLALAIAVATAVRAVARAQDVAPAAPCIGPPSPPSSVNLTMSDLLAVVRWTASAGSPTSYVVEAGSSPGASNISVTDTGKTATSMEAIVPAGTYYVRVRARNACGLSDPSRDASADARAAYDDHPDVVVARKTAARNVYFPAVAKLGNGELLVAYYDSPEHVSPDGRIALVRSRDGGRTWSVPHIAVDTPLDDRDPSVAVTRNGRVLLSYFTRTGDEAAPGAVFVVRSDDNGETWSAPAPVDAPLAGAATSARIVEMANGDLLIPIYGVAAGQATSRAAIVRSRDGGLTWPRDQAVEIGATPGISFQEPALAVIDGRVLAVMRTDAADNAAYETHSIDGGRTWSQPAAIRIAAQASELLPLAADSTDTARIAHAWGDWSRRYGDSRPTVVQVIRWPGADRGPVFGEPHLVYNGHCDDASYPSVVALDDSRLFVVFYDACAGYIGGAYVPVSALR
jgi:hypothetical protein